MTGQSMCGRAGELSYQLVGGLVANGLVGGTASGLVGG